METVSIGRLREALSGELPGATAQYRMAHQLRRDYGKAPQSARLASVLALIYPVAGHQKLLFIQRTSPANDHHAGQISFPGGSHEEVDADAGAAALREAREEVGVDISTVELLGKLSPLYIPISNFLVYPFVGYTDQRPEFRLQEAEVARILELPLEAFLRSESRVVKDKQLANGMFLTQVPHWQVAGEEIWGATAMITSELIALLEAND